MYNKLETKVMKLDDKHLGIKISNDLAKMLHVRNGSKVSLAFKDEYVELRSKNYKLPTGAPQDFESLEMIGEPIFRFSRQFGAGRTGKEICIADTRYLCLYDAQKLVAIMRYEHALDDWVSKMDTHFMTAKKVSTAELNEHKYYIIKWENRIPNYCPDAYYSYHAILVLESMMILGEGCKIYYPDKPYPMYIVDKDREWCILIKPRINEDWQEE